MAALERVHAISNRLSRHHLTPVANVLSGMARMAFGVRLPPSVEVGRGSYFSAGGLGTVVHRHAKIGSDCVISAGVTIGARQGNDDVPVIEDGCFIGAGARILGAVHVGPRSVVGANAVVIADVPPDSTVVGVPARVVDHARREQLLSLAEG